MKKTVTLDTLPNVTGTSATDGATIQGSSGTPTGTVTFTFYSGTFSNGIATGYSNTQTLSGGTATSISTPSLAASSYYFMVTYSGDGAYSAITQGSPESFVIIPSSAPKPPSPPKVPPYKIPSSAPQTGLGGAAKSVDNGGLIAAGGMAMFAGLAAMVLALRRRRKI